jgi:hypothetical protein
MSVLMAAIAVAALIAGPTLLTGQPLFIVVGLVLAGAVLLATWRGGAARR